ncbi:hypothetical protein RHGRI_032642 [Rhododendron griersonianum]|uniref:Uncharacterized protein n=1 Tax=Rhododendron griersonianum TaxID=479676 RepID=A0AAV6IFU2_9ERIC|nr:hypothetical protein RHGRI_032642 [Rhododendron griersonianum]
MTEERAVVVVPIRTMRDYLNPTRTSTPTCIVLPTPTAANAANNFTVKPGYLNMLPTFHALELENPYLHVRDFEDVVENSQSWDYSNLAERTTHVVSFDQLNAGKIVFREQEDLSQKVAHLTRKLEKLELTKAKEVAVIAKVDEMCHICDMLGHSTNECPTIPAFKEVLHGTIEQVDVNALNQAQNQARQPVNFPLSATYTPEWRKHSNFSWRNADNPGPSQGPLGPPMGPNVYQPPHKRTIEETLQMFMQGQSTINEQNAQLFGDIKTQLSKSTSSMGVMQQEKGKFPAQPQANPQGQHFVSSSSGTSSNVEEAKSISTLRSGKEIDKTIIPKPKPTAPVTPPFSPVPEVVKSPSGDSPDNPVVEDPIVLMLATLMCVVVKSAPSVGLGRL